MTLHCFSRIIRHWGMPRSNRSIHQAPVSCACCSALNKAAKAAGRDSIWQGNCQCDSPRSLSPIDCGARMSRPLTLKNRFNTHKSNCPAKSRGAPFNEFYPKRSGPSFHCTTPSFRRSTSDRILLISLSDINCPYGFINSGKIALACLYVHTAIPGGTTVFCTLGYFASLWAYAWSWDCRF
jgi:hypothetical protein